jgi:hypothetical protein
MSKHAGAAADTLHYFAASVTTTGFAGLTWFTTLSEFVKVGAGLAAIGMFVITLIKFFKENRNKINK